MQIVIDIPEEIYESSKREYEETDDLIMDIFTFAIAKGTPLPKGHGRLIDEDEVIECIKEVEGEDAIWAIGLIEWACEKRTIVEADKAERSDEE